ncbi:TetR/AcrR family transcriptional regulator [Bacillus sp. FJAT-53060]|uniref:TetR/AcrR family transcriptional regulator n=1 Tax=Bacillus sp. FJAT-53060 TaxID=3127666 RepID=UPI00301385E9
MNEKQEEILRVSKKLFSQKGYMSVSMQSIADACKVSKASIYKLFDSKEELLLELIKYNQRKMREISHIIHSETRLSKKEKFTKKIKLELEEFKENHKFLSMLSFEAFSQHPPIVKKHLRETRSIIMQRHRDIILSTYGESVAPYVWDLVIVLNGLMREFILMLAIEHKNIQLENAAEMIIGVMDRVSTKPCSIEPVLTNELMDSYLFSPQDEYDEEKQVITYLTKMKQELHSLSNGEEKDHLLSAFELLNQELSKDQPRTFLISSLLDYLGKNSFLSQNASQLKSIIL